METDESGWQPIETAPFHKPVLLGREGFNPKVGTVSFAGPWKPLKNAAELPRHPTHWMPLPPPPPGVDR